MNDVALKADTRDIVIDEVFPHAPEVLWKTLTSGELMARWLMPSEGFEAVVGNRFTLQTRAAGAWDGVIHCEVLQVTPGERLAYGWRGGDVANVGYGSRLDTVVTWTLAKVEGGARLRLVHSGFVLPDNDTAFRNMSEGWKTVVQKVDSITAEYDA